MNLIFTYVVTALLIAIGLLSLGQDFIYAPFYIFLSLLGLALSFWQQKKQPIPYLRLVINIILILLTFKALFPFFAGRPKYDMFTALIKTWAYFLVLSTYIIYRKRDYYIIQGFSLGLIVYACFYATRNPLLLLGYTAMFLAIWIMVLRNTNLFTDSKEEKTVSYTAEDIWREIKLGAILFLAVLIVSMPFYFLTPRFNIPLLPMDQLLRQRYSSIYADFPKRGLVAYLSRNPRDIMTESKRRGGETPGPTEKKVQESQIEISHDRKKPIFWHDERAMDDLVQQIQNTSQQLKDLARQKERQKSIAQEEKINNEKKELEESLRKAREEYAKLTKAQSDLRQDQMNTPAAWDLASKIETIEDQIDSIEANLTTLDTKLQELGEAKKSLATQDKVTDIEKSIREFENLAAQEEKINNEKNELGKTLKMQGAQAQRQEIENKLKELDTQLQKIKEAKEQVRASVYQQSLLISPEIRQLWDKKEELESQLKALREGIDSLTEQQEAASFMPQLKEIEKLEQKIQETNRELKDLAQEKQLPDINNYIREFENLAAQEEKINNEKNELGKILEETKEEYLKMAQVQANPPAELADNAAALRELDDDAKKAGEKIQNIVEQRKGMDKQIEKIKEAVTKIRESIYRQSSESTQQIRILWDKKEEQHSRLQKLKQEAKIPPVQETIPGKPDVKAKPAPGPPRRITRQITILDIILYILIITALIYVVRSILAFILPYLRHKRRILQACRKEQHNLSISLVYNFLGRLLYIFGYRYPIVMLPEEYLEAINQRFTVISQYTQELTELFIEARYSGHRLDAEQEKRAFESYRNILQELKNSGTNWQRQILKMGFLFEL